MSKKIILIGAGGVGTAILEMFERTLKGKKLCEKFSKIVILDKVDITEDPVIKNFTLLPYEFYKIEITPVNIETVFHFISENDLVLDVSYNIYFKPLLQACLIKNANYINTSLERWPLENEEDINIDFKKRTLHEMNKEVFSLRDQTHQDSPTIILTHGMNPGLISHFVFLGLITISKKIIENARDDSDTKKISKLKKYVKKLDYARISKLLGVKMVHCSEIDTQEPYVERGKNEFVNTWGCYSLYSEGVDPVQLGVGSEVKFEPDVRYEKSEEEDNQIFLYKKGIDKTAVSYVHDRKINGMLISHTENDTLSLKLTSKKKRVYRPSVYYVYSPCKSAQESINEVKENGYKMLEKKHLLRGAEIKSGYDEVGALLVFENDPYERLVNKQISPCLGFWSGTILDIKTTREMGLVYSGPTVVQVGASILSCMNYIEKNPRKGILFPEDLFYYDMLEFASEFLGEIYCDFIPFQIQPGNELFLW